MAEPFPKTIPRSTLACPPAKNFMDQYSKSGNVSVPGQTLSSKASTTQIVKKESEKELPMKPSVKELHKGKFDTNQTNENVRGSSKEALHIKNPPPKEISKKGSLLLI